MGLIDRSEKLREIFEKISLNKKILGITISGVALCSSTIATFAVPTPPIPSSASNSASASSTTNNDLTDRIDQSITINIANGEDELKQYTVKPNTIEKTLKDLHINYYPIDEINVPLNSITIPNENIIIKKANLKTQFIQEKINYQTKKLSDPVDCDKDTDVIKIVTVGSSGIKNTVQIVKIVNGQEETPDIVSSSIDRQPITEEYAYCKDKTQAQETIDSSASSTPTTNSSSSSSSNNTSSSDTTSLPKGSHEDWMKEAGIPESDWGYVNYIVTHESGWDYKAVNVSSGATGLPQALPGSKMGSAGSDWRTNPVTQLKWADSYAKGRYGSWKGAYDFWVSHRWW